MSGRSEDDYESKSKSDSDSSTGCKTAVEGMKYVDHVFDQVVGIAVIVLYTQIEAPR